MSPASTPLVSIVIPTYNCSRLLPEAVASCLVQTYINIEILIVDDGSTDNTREMVTARLREEWWGKVQYHWQQNSGGCSARNAGMRLARGDYVQFLDSDDLLRPEKISHQIAAIQAANDSVDCCACYGRLGSLDSGWDGAKRIGEACPDAATFIRRQCERTVHIMHTEAPLWRREFLCKAADWNEALTASQEWEFYVRLLTKSPRLAYVPEDLFFVRSHGGEQISKGFGGLKHSLSFYRAIRGVSELLRPTPFWTPPVRSGLLMRARTTYVNLLRNGVSGEALREVEDWLSNLACNGGDRKMMAALWMRRNVGANIVLMVFDALRRQAVETD